MKRSIAPWMTIIIGILSLANIADAQEKAATGVAKLEGQALFEQLKTSLQGDWEGTLEPISKPVVASFFVVGNGSALVEDIRRLDRDFRMLSVYHLDDDVLRMTHFCSYRNQPRLRAKSVSSNPMTIEFEFVDITNLSSSGDKYTYKIIVSLVDESAATITYFGVDHGAKGSLTANLKRVGRRAHNQKG